MVREQGGMVPRGGDWSDDSVRQENEVARDTYVAGRDININNYFGDASQAEGLAGLAAQVRGNLLGEKRRLKTHNPEPLRVPWKPKGTEGAATPGSILDAYQAAPNGRLVIVGERVSVQIVMVLLLALELLEDRQKSGYDPGMPVPVIFSIGSS